MLLYLTIQNSKRVSASYGTPIQQIDDENIASFIRKNSKRIIDSYNNIMIN